MKVDLPAEQQAIIENLVSSGRFSSAGEAVTEGLRLLVSSERLRQQVQEGIEQADRGELIDHDTVFGQLRAMAAATQAPSGH
ncbi:MAG: CopG family transcriptional regulator [Planctomycetes bacterium]|nr:CopG family transcriptional regulator [Planctomycetota bacterium]